MTRQPPEIKTARPLPANPARFWALAALRKVEDGLTANEALAAAGNARDYSGPQLKDRALAQALIYETIRHKSYLDWLGGQFLKKPGRRLTPLLRSILRLGLAQIIYFDRLPSHAVVMETVNLAKIMAPGSEGLVNSVLRTVLTAAAEGRLPQPEQDPQLDTLAQRLAVRHSHPLWLVERELAARPQEKAEARLVANNQAAPLTLRVNPGRVTRERLAGSFEALGLNPKPTRYSPWGLNLPRYQGPLNRLPGFNQGLFSVQDEASQIAIMAAVADLPSRALILDIGAGLGGKTTALAGLKPEATIVACDIDHRKLAHIPPEIERLQLTATLRLTAGDLTDSSTAQSLRPTTDSPGFDLIFLDAPCSGLGAIRRRPDLKWRKSPADIPRLAQKQLALLAAAESLLGEGGRLIYAVCTTTGEETWGVVEAFLKTAQARLTPPPAINDAMLLDRDCLSLAPEISGTDGFFAAFFTRE